MTKIDVSDIQGFALKGYNFPYARYLLLELLHHKAAESFIRSVVPHITTGVRWDDKPLTTVNVAFTHRGLIRLQLPEPTLLSFPVEFQQGMKARGNILYDTGKNAPSNWDPVWKEDRVHVWLGVNARTTESLDGRCTELRMLMDATGGARLLQAQDASAVFIDGKPTTKEHFGYTDEFGNPDFKGAERDHLDQAVDYLRRAGQLRDLPSPPRPRHPSTISTRSSKSPAAPVCASISPTTISRKPASTSVRTASTTHVPTSKKPPSSSKKPAITAATPNSPSCSR
jgi:hypothetical protein